MRLLIVGTLKGQLTTATKIAMDTGNPDGDAVFGVDNTFASRAIDQGALEAYTPAEIPDGVSDFDLPGDEGILGPQGCRIEAEQLVAADTADEQLPVEARLEPARLDMFDPGKRRAA